MSKLFEIGDQVVLTSVDEDDLVVGFVEGGIYTIIDIDMSDQYIYCIRRADADTMNWREVWGWVEAAQVEKAE